MDRKQYECESCGERFTILRNDGIYCDKLCQHRQRLKHAEETENIKTKADVANLAKIIEGLNKRILVLENAATKKELESQNIPNPLIKIIQNY